MRITAPAINALAAAAPQAADGLETGGILLGHDAGLTGDFVVRHCGDAGPKAVRTRTFFLRDLAHARFLADQAYALDRSEWIGEWHTHGIPLPFPSERDLRTYRHLLADPELGFARFLAIIVLASPDADWTRPTVHAWSFTGSVLRELPIAVVDTDDHYPSASADQSSEPGSTQ